MTQKIVIDWGSDSPALAENSEAPKEVLHPYLGLWVNGIGGNTPVAIFNPELEDIARTFAENLFPNKHIFASIQLPARKLITRQSTKAIKQFGVNVLTKLLEKTEQQSEVEEVTSLQLSDGQGPPASP